MNLSRVVLVAATALALTAATGAGMQDGTVYRPALAVPDFVEPFLEQVEPGRDQFTAEGHALALEARLRDFGEQLRREPRRAAAASTGVLAPGFRGAPLLPPQPSGRSAGAAIDVMKAGPMPDDLSLDARTFGTAFARLVEGMRDVQVAEFLITAIDAADPESVRTDVRYDIVGSGPGAWRLEQVGTWDMRWRRIAGEWRVAEWRARSHVTSRAERPIFSEITQAAFQGVASFREQLGIDLDAWMATIDAVLTRDTNGHHGVSVGDADGDGLEDLYVSQPAGLPNRLYRARGDSTFDDVTDGAGAGVLDDTAQSLFADVDNDGDQDLVLSTGSQPLLLVNDGTGRFAHAPDAFRFRRPLQGLLTSIAMADYDRDGFLDLYLCVYSYFYGAGEDKAGTPMPYYDARNGPPGVLFRNDGRGRFVDVTAEAGLDEGNDRYHFAAAWADYDGDGWPDLFVANDFGTKNLYRNRGGRAGAVTFEEVAAGAGVLDHGAGMSATFLDYDNDGRLDIYAGNMWSASGLRVTASSAFMPDAPEDVRALYRRHARGNSLFRNLGDGRFEDTTLDAGAEMGRWAWSSDALDFDNDGWEDLYIVNGMLTRDGGREDLEGFFWRQVVARSPLGRAKGTPYDEAWRAINQLLIHRSIASRQRNVFLRNDGQGGFDDVSGSVGLDLDQDGRSFAVLDIDRDGDSDLAVMAARQAPQLRLFRNDVAAMPAFTLRLAGTKSNRDAIGARVLLEVEDREGKVSRRMKIVQAGSGFLSQHSKELSFGIRAEERVRSLTVEWPSGARQVFEDVPEGGRLRLVEGGTPERARFAPKGEADGAAGASARSGDGIAPLATWLYEPVPAPDFSLVDAGGTPRSISGLEGPAVLLLWSAQASASRAAVETLARGEHALRAAGVAALALAVDDAAAPAGGGANAPVPMIRATHDVALGYGILYRHLFMNRQDLPLPTALLLDAAGRVTRVYRERIDVPAIVRDAAALEVTAAERLRRALPFPGAFHAPLAPRNYLPYGRELLDQDLDAAALVAFERAARANPSASTLYRLGTLLLRSGNRARARAAFERALALQPDLAEASNDLGALLARDGEIEQAIERFRAALAATPEYPDALNNLGYALLLTGREEDARGLYEKALALQPDFPEALNNLGMLLGRAGDLPRAERYFRDALARRADYGEAANNLALVLVASGRTEAAVRLLEAFVAATPEYEGTYVTLAKIHLGAGRAREGLETLQALLQRNPTHGAALELLRAWKPR